uniref:Uncharacterized protein n=1 Tax=viral metagenome TaxID=1070528 RepID=A0A6C0EE90_9ZZZZ
MEVINKIYNCNSCKKEIDNNRKLCKNCYNKKYKDYYDKVLKFKLKEKRKENKIIKKFEYTNNNRTILIVSKDKIKKCKECNIIKDINDFYISLKYKDNYYLQPRCKKCYHDLNKLSNEFKIFDDISTKLNIECA